MRTTSDSLDLSTFPRPLIGGNRSLVWRATWLVVSTIIFRPSVPLASYAMKAGLLRLFGAVVGDNLTIKPSVNVKYPWLLRVGKNVWIGEGVWLDNPGMITIGDNVCISQAAYLVTGNHDFRSARFEFFSEPIEVGDRCWIAARATIPPGSRIPVGTVVPIGSVWKRSVNKVSSLSSGA